MASSNAVIRGMLTTRYPQFATVDSDRLDALLDDARLLVPLCRLGDRADLALMYKAGALLCASLSTSATGSSSGDIKRVKVGQRETEYQTASGSSTSNAATGRDFESLYAALVRPLVRNSPRVLGYTG